MFYSQSAIDSCILLKVIFKHCQGKFFIGFFLRNVSNTNRAKPKTTRALFQSI